MQTPESINLALLSDIVSLTNGMSGVTSGSSTKCSPMKTRDQISKIKMGQYA